MGRSSELMSRHNPGSHGSFDVRRKSRLFGDRSLIESATSYHSRAPARQGKLTLGNLGAMTNGRLLLCTFLPIDAASKLPTLYLPTDLQLFTPEIDTVCH
jgi:hypothetical protein